MERASPLSPGRLGGLVVSEERTLAGRMAGLLYLLAAITGIGLLLLPNVEREHPWAIAAIALVGGIWAVAALTIVPWERASPLVSHLSTAAGLPAAGLVIWLTGGPRSPALAYLFFIVVYAAFFYPAREAWPHVLGCVAVLCAPLVYSHEALHGPFLAVAIILSPTYVLLAGLLIGGKDGLVALREQARDLALHDSLTGLANRRLLMETLEAHVAEGRRESDHFALVMLDVDDFKLANTRFGHQGGDQVLRATALSLLDAARTDDVVARLGGDEFAVVARGADAGAMREVTDRLVRSVREVGARLGDDGKAVTASAGWACFPGDADSVEGLIAVADAAMRRAKAVGKDRAAEPEPELVA